MIAAMERRCFFISTNITPHPNNQQITAMGKELAVRGHQVIHIIGNHKWHLQDSASNPAISVWPSRRPTRARDAWFLRRLIDHYRPNCVVADGYASTSIVLLVGSFSKVPYRVTWYRTMQQGIHWHESGLSLAQRWRSCLLAQRRYTVYRLTRPYFIANSEAARRDVTTLLALPEQRSVTFHNAMADPQLVAAHQSQARAGIVCVGRLSPEKGQDVLVRAVALLAAKYPGIHVAFIGEGGQRVNYSRLANELGIAAYCSFLGPLPHQEVLARMGRAYLSIVPSRSEAFGRVVIESMAMGTPVMASHVGGIPELIRDGVDGFLVPPDDPEALAGKISAVLDNPQMQREMCQNARQRFLTDFEEGVIIPRMADWFEALVQ